MKSKNVFPVLGLVALLLGSSPVIGLAASQSQKGQIIKPKPLIIQTQKSPKPIVRKVEPIAKPTVSTPKKSVTRPVTKPQKKTSQ